MLAPALKLLNRQGILLLGQQDPHPHQHLLCAHGARYIRGEHRLCRPHRRLDQVALSQPYRQAGIYHPARIVSRSLLLNQGFELVQGLLCGLQIPACQPEPGLCSPPKNQQLHLVPVLRAQQRTLQPVRGLLQPIASVADGEERILQIA